MSCSTPQVAGDWSGRVAPAHFEYLEVRLTQTGTAFGGTACYKEAPNYIMFTNAEVSGKYPTVTVHAPDYNDFWFVGRFEDDGTLRGQWHNKYVAPYPMSLSRSASTVTGCLNKPLRNNGS